MAQHKVLKPFAYADDGHTTRQTAVDEVLNDVDPGVVQGLIDGGFVVDITGEASSKLAGEAIAAADHAGTVDSDKAVHEEMDQAKAHISDGKIGAPEAATIVDGHKLIDGLADPVTKQAAEDEKAAHEAGNVDFDPKAPENRDAASAKLDEPELDDAAIEAMKVAELKAAIEAKGGTVDPTAKKADLQDQLTKLTAGDAKE